MAATVPRLRTIVIAAALAAAGLLAARGLGDRLFFRPSSRTYDSGIAPALRGDEVRFRAGDGEPLLHGVWLPARGADRGIVVFCHGNVRNLSWHERYCAWLPARGYTVLLFDYRGYGQSEGTPTREGAIADAVAALDLALAREPRRTFVFGHSLGGAIGVCAAAQRPDVRAVVAESTFSSYRAVARATAPWLAGLVNWLVTAGEDPEDAVARLAPAPLLVIHGTEDRIVPMALGQQLYRRAQQPKELWLVQGAGHKTPWVQLGVTFEERICSFFQRAVRPGR